MPLLRNRIPSTGILAPPPINSKLWIKVSGVWKEATPWIKVSGVWTQVTRVWFKDLGVWK